MAQSGLSQSVWRCPLLGVEQTWFGRGPMSPFDPKRKSPLLGYKEFLPYRAGIRKLRARLTSYNRQVWS
jgi:hypothetical protein